MARRQHEPEQNLWCPNIQSVGAAASNKKLHSLFTDRPFYR